ncbi:uncharacterized protein BXZ73DRAFT_5453, partial [Epithele typhae]|uniref:uncharacterized protein n=1 Tax=Epithele typhae TaxID=378194 RepID=UPI0020074A35
MAHMAVPADFFAFCDNFFPAGSDIPQRKVPLKLNPFAGFREAEKWKESKLQEKFVKVINQHELAAGLKMAISSDRPANTGIDAFRQKGDAAFFHEEYLPNDETPNWGDQVISVEFKKGGPGRKDPFDNEGNFASAKDRTTVRGQIISYGELILAVQQRCELFTLLVVGRTCHFVYWDRSGAIATNAIDYYKDHEAFCDILWRLGHASDSQLGMDDTAIRLRPGDGYFRFMDNLADMAAHAAQDILHDARSLDSTSLGPGEFVYVRQMWADSLVKGWPRYLVELIDEAGKKHTFLIAKPSFVAKGLAGRATRGYVAYHIDAGRFRWFKDSWRAEYILVEQEGAILKELNDAGVPNVPTLVCHGDVGEQRTITPMWWKVVHAHEISDSATGAPAQPGSTSSKRKRGADKGAEEPQVDACPLRLHRHYRMVVAEVAMPLSMFQHTFELLDIIQDAVSSSEPGLGKLKQPRLHRDISAGNILIYPKVYCPDDGKIFLRRSGILADWEMSKRLAQPGESEKARQPPRTGTWQYQAVSLLLWGPHIAGIAEELESIWHVLLYELVRYMPTSLLPPVAAVDVEAVARFIDQYFDQYVRMKNRVTGEDEWLCGTFKKNTIISGELRTSILSMDEELLRFGNEAIDTLMRTLLWRFSRLYRV